MPKLKNKIEKDACTPMFIAALFIIARAWMQPRCSLTDEWIKKMWNLYAVAYYSAIKKHNKAFIAIWMQPKIIILSEVSQRKTNTI